MTAAVALRDLIVTGVVVVLLGVFVEPFKERRSARREAEQQAHRDAVAYVAREHAQSALDAAYARAERQALFEAELGLGWVMPSREQIEAAASDGGHDRLDMTDTDRALQAAALEAAFCHEERPPITADTSDPDGTNRW